MLKAVVLLKSKQGLTRDEFIHHYEQNHVPLVRKLLPSIGRYVRNYLSPDSVSASRQHAAASTAPTPYFDVITELWFDDQPAYDRFVAALGDPAISRELQQDEERFLDRTVVQTFPVIEFAS
jgi:uncharacterized protein (TIGR02118 family)